MRMLGKKRGKVKRVPVSEIKKQTKKQSLNARMQTLEDVMGYWVGRPWWKRLLGIR